MASNHPPAETMNRLCPRLLALALVYGLAWLQIALVGAAADSRIWTDNQGREVTASLADVDGAEVVLRLEDGRKATFPIADLSADDQAYVESMADSLDTPSTPANDSQRPSPDAATGNWNAPWPNTVRISPTIAIETDTEEDGEEVRYIYRSPHFEFTCDARLGPGVVQRFAIIFEATHAVMKEIPLNHRRTFSAHDEHFKVQLFENTEDYFRAGAPRGSAGVYMGGKDLIMIPLSSLGVIPFGSGYRYDHDRSNTTLIHELVHQLMENIVMQASWYIEGSAEYVASIPYRSGTFNLRSHRRALVDYVTAFGSRNSGGRNLGDEISMPSLEQFMNLSYQEFAGGAAANRNYGIAALLFYYFAHIDKEGDGSGLKAYTRALQDGMNEKEAQKFLLADRAYNQLQEDFSAAWRASGIDFKFPGS